MKRLVTLIVTPLPFRGKGACLPVGPDLPPKSSSTLRTLTVMRTHLIGDLSAFCIRDFFCYDFPRAKDFMRTSTCEFYDLLMKEYGSNAWQREDEVADEAVNIAIACWNHFNGLLKGDSWVSILQGTIVQYVGRPLRSQKRQQPAVVAIPVSASPEPRASESSEEIRRREKLLSEYKLATGNPSNRKIYAAENSGIHKPEFYQWKDGRLPAESKTAKTFESFLRAKRRPIPRRPAS